MTVPLAETSLQEWAQMLEQLLEIARTQGYLTYSEVNDHLPSDIVDPEQIEDIINMINDMGIAVHETPPDLDAMLLSPQPTRSSDGRDR